MLDKQHPSVTLVDQLEADRLQSSLLYGEILYPGVRTLLNPQHLGAAQASTLYDLGMGCGRLILQSFLEYPNLQRVVGIELAYSRFFTAADAVIALANMNHWSVPGTSQDPVCAQTRPNPRPHPSLLILSCDSLTISISFHFKRIESNCAGPLSSR